MSVKSTTRDACDLLLQGSLTLARMEHEGMRVDVPYLDEVLESTARRIAKREAWLKKGEVWQTWQKRFGVAANLWSDQQLGKVLFDVFKRQDGGKTKTGRYKTDDETLANLDDPWIKKYVGVKKLKKARGTYLEGIKRELVGDRVHVNYKLHSVETFRSSASDPNIQNQIMRDAEMAEIVRRCFICPDDRVMVEVDYSALEFKGAAAFWCDPEMIRYASDPTLDVHRDVTAKIYQLPLDKVPKACRSIGKNQFTFPVLYGSDYINCSRGLWEHIDKLKLTTADGIGLKEHLASKGIDRLGELDRNVPPEKGTFEKHVKGVQEWFMGLFPGFAQRRITWWQQYQERGWFDLATGFRIRGHYTRNFLYNAPVQGPSFHLMLWSLIQIDKEIRRRKMRSRLVAEIHDSLLAYVPPDEVQEFIDLCERVMTQDVREHWDWVTVPLAVEVDVSATNWWDKRPFVRNDKGLWVAKVA